MSFTVLLSMLSIACVRNVFPNVPGGRGERTDEQTTHEDSTKMDEREAETEAHLQSCRAAQAVPVHNLVHKSEHQGNKTSELFFRA